MTFAEMLSYLGAHCKSDIMDGDPAETVNKARSGSHKNPVAGEIIGAMFDKSGLTSVDGEISRAEAVNAIGPVRLRFMKDDAPVEGFRMVEDIVHGIDGAFNDEALRMKEAGKAV